MEKNEQKNWMVAFNCLNKKFCKRKRKKEKMAMNDNNMTIIIIIIKRNTTIYFNTNYRTEMKLVSIIIDFCPLQFDALKFFLGVRLHGGLHLTLIFSM